MIKKDSKAFCETHYKPLIAALLITVVVIFIWATYHELKMRNDKVYASQYHGEVFRHPVNSMHPGMGVYHPGMGHHPGMGMNHPEMGMQLQPVAATGGIPPIKLSDVVTHPNYGQDCTKCHTVVGKKTKGKIAGGTITNTANLTHPYWGPCNVCHKVVNNKGQVVAFASSDPRSILGVDLTEANATLTTELNLPDKKGPIVVKILDGGVAQQAGIQRGDMFYMIGNEKVETIDELQRALSQYTAGDVIRITMWHERRQKIYRVSLPTDGLMGADTAIRIATGGGATPPFDPGNAAQGEIDPGNNGAPPEAVIKANPSLTTPQGTVIALGTPAGVNILAVGSDGTDLNSQVGSQLGISPYFIIVDLQKNTYKVIQNAGGAGQQVAQDLMDMGAQAVITGSAGQGVMTSLSNLNIQVYSGVTGDVKGAIVAFQQGSLKPQNGDGNTNAEQVAPTGPDATARGVVF